MTQNCIIRKRAFSNKCSVKTILLLLGLFFANSILAQNQSLTGEIVDDLGEPIIGAMVMVKGTTKGTITDATGQFVLSNLSQNDVIQFSYVGYREQEVVFTGQRNVRISLQENVEILDEVVVVGYGSLSKREVSSSIVQVNRSDFQQGAMSNPMEMLQGKVAGLSVNLTDQANPNAGTDNALQIRGAASISASNSPLIIIDGIAGGDYQSLSAQDIESVTVLKDAGSAAIYGTRGANGVVLITTRRGSAREGTHRITYDSWLGVNIAKPKPDILSPEEFREKDRDTDYGASTDWWDLLMRDFSYDTNQYLSIDGTTKNGFYGASINYRKATGLDMVTDRQEYGGRFTIQQRGFDNWVEFNATLNVRKVNETNGRAGWGGALTTNPTYPVFDEEGNYFQPTSPTGASTPKSNLDQTIRKGDRTYVLGSAELKVHLLKKANQSLNVSLNHSLNFRDHDNYEYQPSTSSDSFWNGYKGNAYRRDRKWQTNQTEFLANYTMSHGDHDFKLVAGYHYEESYYEKFDARNFDFAFDQTTWDDMGSGTYLKAGKSELGTEKNMNKLIGVFGRINYNWKNLLMASASYRREGSTKFGPENKWGDFMSASAAWELANMPFMQNVSMVNSLKPRASYGVTGRSDFDPYLSQQNYKADGLYYMDGGWTTGFAPAVNANPGLAWEKAIITNIGIDFSLWKNRLRGSIEYYDRQSKDLLYRYTAPQPPFVHEQIMVNVGTIQNRGFELSLDGDILTKTPLKWTSGIVLSNGNTTLKKLSNDVFEVSYLRLGEKGGPGTSEYYFRVTEGGKIGQFYGLKTAGVDENGNMEVYNQNNEVIPIGDAKNEDKRFIGNGTPKYFLSWNNSLTYKQFDLNIFWRGAFGFDIYNERMYGMGLEGCGTSNVLRSAYDTELKHPGGLISSYFLENGNFFKLENVTLGYNYKPRQNKFMDNMRVYLSAKNLFTITSYSGNDPSIVRVNGLEPGLDDSGAYPQAMVLTLGVTINFK